MYILAVLVRTIIVWGWAPILITALAIVGAIYDWSLQLLIPVLGVILVFGLIAAGVSGGERRLEILAMKLRNNARNFSRRFMSTSSLSIFTIIDTLFSLEDPQLWDWARACDMSALVFNGWSDSFIDRIENDSRTGRFRSYLHVYLNELWLMNNHYYEFVEQFHEIAEKLDIPPSTRDQYERFAVEYNTFVQNFRETVAELQKAAGTEIEPPGIKLAPALTGIKQTYSTPSPAPDPAPAPNPEGGPLR